MSRKGMPLLKRNSTTFEYLPPDGVESDLNEDGEHTGEFYPKHADPVEYRGSISLPSGAISQNLFGTDTRDTHVLVMRDPETEISELGMIRWKGDLYEIRAVRPSLDTLSVALRKKTANNGEPYEEEPVTGATGATGETGGEPG